MKCLVCLFICVLISNLPAGVPATKVVILGIAQDGGVPHIGCSQEICRTQRQYVSSLAVIQGDSVYLIDATPDLREQYSGLIHRYPNLEKKNLFNGIFLTHAHMGHYTGLIFLGKESVSTKQVPVYCSEEMGEYLRKNAPWSLLVQNQNIEIKRLTPGRPVDPGFSIRPVAVPHRREFTDTFGYLIKGSEKTLLYIPDIDAWEPVRNGLQEWLTQSDFALLDGTFYSGQELPGRDIRQVPHPTVEHSLSFFKELPTFKAQVFFTHLNHTNPLLSPESAEKKELDLTAFRVARVWQEFSL